MVDYHTYNALHDQAAAMISMANSLMAASDTPAMRASNQRRAEQLRSNARALMDKAEAFMKSAPKPAKAPGPAFSAPAFVYRETHPAPTPRTAPAPAEPVYPPSQDSGAWARSVGDDRAWDSHYSHFSNPDNL